MTKQLLAVAAAVATWVLVPPVAPASVVPGSGTIEGSAVLTPVAIDEIDQVKLVLAVDVANEEDYMFILQVPDGLDLPEGYWDNVIVDYSRSGVLVRDDASELLELTLGTDVSAEGRNVTGFGLAAVRGEFDLSRHALPADMVEDLATAPAPNCDHGGPGASGCSIEDTCSVDCISGYYACCDIRAVLDKCYCVPY